MESTLFLKIGPPHRVVWVRSGKDVETTSYLASHIVLPPADWKPTKDGFVLTNAYPTRNPDSYLVLAPLGNQKMTAKWVAEIIAANKVLETAL